MSPEWLAGFFDGEGCLTMWKARRSHYTPAVVFTNTDEGTLQKIQVIYGGKLYLKPRTTQHWSQAYALMFVGARKVKALLEKLAPYVITKKPEVDFYLANCEVLKGTNGVRVLAADIQARENFKLTLSSFKSRSKLKTQN